MGCRRRRENVPPRTRRKRKPGAHAQCIFLQRVKLTLDQWSANGDKTNEPGSLKTHLAELLKAYLALQLLTGDAIYAQRPLVEIFKQHGCVTTCSK